MTYTQTELVSAALADPDRAPMRLHEIVSEEIRVFRSSPRYRELLEADAYYRNRSDVQRKAGNGPGRSNVRLEHPIYKKLVDQKARYLLSRPWAVETEDRAYGQALEELFDAGFRHTVKALGRDAVKSGVAWLQPYIGPAGRLEFLRLPAHEVVPLWRDAGRSELDGFLRVYPQTVYAGREARRVERAEYWSGDGLRRFLCADGSGRFRPDGEPEPHFTLGGRGYNWSRVPLVWLRYNEEELPLCRYVRDLIDDYNWQTSVTADALRDVAKFVYILKNYGGADLDEFVRDLRQCLAVKVEGDGGVDKLQTDLDVSAVLAFLERERRDLFDFASAVDTRDPDLGSASGTALGFRYMDLDADCADLADELQAAFRRLKPFLDTWLQATGRGDFSGAAFRVDFNMDMPVNESEVIANVNASRELLSPRTLLANHPWVADVERELREREEVNL